MAILKKTEKRIMIRAMYRMKPKLMDRSIRGVDGQFREIVQSKNLWI